MTVKAVGYFVDNWEFWLNCLFTRASLSLFFDDMHIWMQFNHLSFIVIITYLLYIAIVLCHSSGGISRVCLFVPFVRATLRHLIFICLQIKDSLFPRDMDDLTNRVQQLPGKVMTSVSGIADKCSIQWCPVCFTCRNAFTRYDMIRYIQCVECL